MMMPDIQVAIAPGARVQSTQKMRVLLVDQHPLFRETVLWLLAQSNEAILVGTAFGCQETLAQAESLRPQVILLDASLARMEAIQALRALLPGVKVIALSLPDGIGVENQSFTAGADVSISKLDVCQELLPAIRRVTGNTHVWLTD